MNQYELNLIRRILFGETYSPSRIQLSLMNSKELMNFRNLEPKIQAAT